MQRFAYGTERPLCRYATGNGVMTLRHGTPRHGSTLALRIALTHRHRHTQSQIQTDLPRNLNLILVKIRLTLLFEIPYDLTFWIDTVIRHDAVLICRQPIKIDAANPTCRRKSIFTPQIWLEITQLNDVVCVCVCDFCVCVYVCMWLFVFICTCKSDCVCVWKVQRNSVL